MASVHLKFVPPTVQNLVSLKIYEATSMGGPFNLIETVTAIGTYPDYITEYTTDDATNTSDWFAIEWLDNKGASSNLSPPVQGNTETLVGEIVDRVMLRDPSLKESVVQQEAEAVVASVFHTTDPYDSTLTATYQQLRGMTYLTMAYSYISELAASASISGAKWVAGIVSMDAGGATTATGGRGAAIDELLKLAGNDLGISMSVILQMANTYCTGLSGAVNQWDESRLLVEIR